MNRKLKISLYLAAIFVAGVVTGMFISFQVVRHMMPRPEAMAARWCGELQSKLTLTPEQVQKIRPIIDDTFGEFKTNLSRDLLLILSNANSRIAVELTTEQKVKFEQIQREQQELISRKIGGEPSGAPNRP